jgi:hypothetical protein
MTRFKEDLLHELTEYAARTAPLPQRRRRRRRFVVLTAAAAASIAAAVALLVPLSASPAYAVTRNADGSVTLTYRRLEDPDGATRDLRAAGVSAQVVILASEGSCVTSPPHGTTLRMEPGSAVSVRVPDGFPPGTFPPAATAQSAFRVDGNRVTVDPAGLPTWAVLFIIVWPHPESRAVDGGVTLAPVLVPPPAPTCWEGRLTVSDAPSSAAGRASTTS